MNSDAPTDPRPISEARLLAMVNASGDSFWESDVERRFVHVNDNMCQMMGYERRELIGRSVLEFMTPAYREEVMLHAARRASDGQPLAHIGPIRHEGEFFRKDGARVWIETVSVPVFDDDARHIGYFGITRDTTVRKRDERALIDANQRLEAQLLRIQELHATISEQAIRDDLTGMHNRRHFIAVAEMALEHARRLGSEVSLVMLDLDHFKHINDAHGHPAGDAALKAVGAVLGAAIRSDDLACRLGGEEFAVLLVNTQHVEALRLAEQWREHLANAAIQADGIGLTLSASFGVATFPEQGPDLAGLLKAADGRMYRAKGLGRNRVIGAPRDGADD